MEGRLADRVLCFPFRRAGTFVPKAWKKKTPVEVVLDQLNKAREDVGEKEEAYKEAKRQYEKLEALECHPKPQHCNIKCASIALTIYSKEMAARYDRFCTDLKVCRPSPTNTDNDLPSDSELPL